MLAISLGGPELLIILAIVLVLFGGAKLPALARSLGRAQREFREGVDDSADSAASKGAPADGSTAD
ncbi:MAG TPA: twin-arginine translocase TatA/TatE family subunit, partial [Acidimicrobiaceae bacterium]|nr:twin-arginine translocase TatA/TatE family subunit [Acidimicrobiaceae bacterium]